MYDSESWVCQKKNESLINAMEMQSSRNMCGLSLKDRCKNSDVKEQCGLKEDLLTRVEKNVCSAVEIAPFKFKCEICGASSLKVYYQQHMAGHKVQELNEEKKKLRLETAPKEDEFIATVPRGKRKAAHKAMVVLEKYKATNSKYKCDMCEFRTECEQELLGHKCDLDGTSCVDSDDSANLSMQSSDESSGEEDENLSEEENQIVNKKKHSKESATSQKSFTVPFTVKNVDMYLKDGCNKFMEFHYTNETLFDEWLHCHFQEIPLEEVEKYLPPLSESCKIKYGNQWASYKRFEATEGEGYCLFTGACVSCMAWAPGPADALQMLAVATCNSIDMPRFSHDALYEHPGLIQIWSCGSLGDKLPDFSLGIVHDFGTIWSIDWCPSGAQAPMSEDPSSKSRLGLLAAACSNGFAYIFSVPHPSSMPNKFYKLHPAAELRLWAKSDQPKHQATAISWSKQKGHSVVAVGYSNGTTAMFDLNSDSPILKYKENDTTIFYPYSDDYSVCSSITGISMYPTMEGGSRTTGLEVLGCSSTMGAMLQVKAAGGAPHAVYSKLAVNGAEFMSPWPALFVAMDDNTSIKPLSELEMWGVGRRAGGARTVAACVCCPRLFTWTPPLLRSVRTHPLYPETKRSIIAAIEMVPLNDEDHKPKRQKVDDDLSFKVEPTVYEDAILKYGIRYQSINYEKRRKAGKVFTGAVRSDMYPLAEVRALAACPSPPRHDWLAVGLHAGFVVVVRT
ncbi:General transcription factor 3C polypeptide 2 [Eumeta japonica]|uniref:General transcription factor 3C polypeptide 2 n=1 Tax=Eumeta variegata TaxID=151549 RepID=A0A4C1VQY6_EUMVA|nr:General transcription factor 3C polypeptide 2 [Eumeta japonica]